MTERRRFLTTLAVSGGALSVWEKPIVERVFLPAHAQTTIVEEEVEPDVVPDRVADATVAFSNGDAIVFDNDNPTPGTPLLLSTFIPALFNAGGYLEHTLTGTAVCSLERIDLSFFIDDQTDNSDISCSQGVTHLFDVSINGFIVGEISFTTPDTGPANPPTPPRSEIINISGSYSFSPIAGTGGTNDDFVIRVEATTTVCSTGGNYRFIPSPAGSVGLFANVPC